jgi:chorismate synthase
MGGLSNGQPVIFRVAIKPTSSIAAEQTTINTAGEQVAIQTKGRHDPCLCPRAVPVVEAMAALVLEDHYKRQAALHS